VIPAANNESEPDFARGINGLLPVIAQDVRNHQVLMLAWMNQEAFQETRRTGRATYYSRSRGKLWRKGEESGHQQKVVEIRIDCDADTILLLVEQQGAACHEGYASCFYRTRTENGLVENQKRLVDPEHVYPPSTST
jgi:phosphoribosyl-AMP cyclohydrolase